MVAKTIAVGQQLGGGGGGGASSLFRSSFMRPLIYDAHSATRERHIWKRFICTLCRDILSVECVSGRDRSRITNIRPVQPSSTDAAAAEDS